LHSEIQRRAVIDIGTNSVKLLVADVAAGLVTPVLEDSKQTRLGRGFYENQLLQAGPIAETAQAVAEFSAKARELKTASIRVIATSAARDARNSTDLLQAVHASSGLRIEIISGEQEAEWAFQGVVTDPKLNPLPLLILDVGGGSTEFIVGDKGVLRFRTSEAIGSVRQLEQMKLNDPPGLEALAECQKRLKELLDRAVAPTLEPALRALGQPARLIGTGGTVTILARMEANMTNFDRDRIEATQLTAPRVRTHLENLWTMTLAERQQVPGLPPKRADVILAGAAIYEAIMRRFGFGELSISTRGLRYAAVLASR
jgi:exopolyphosphatase / guanosine-5'-triphosphate,3'-diphosphate pyrophosphatase